MFSILFDFYSVMLVIDASRESIIYQTSDNKFYLLVDEIDLEIILGE